MAHDSIASRDVSLFEAMLECAPTVITYQRLMSTCACRLHNLSSGELTQPQGFSWTPAFLNSVGTEFIMLNLAFFARGSIHQGSNRFSDISRGRQCAFMSLSALLCVESCDISSWTSDTIDRILIEGDVMYLKAFEDHL